MSHLDVQVWNPGIRLQIGGNLGESLNLWVTESVVEVTNKTTLRGCRKYIQKRDGALEKTYLKDKVKG